MAKKTTKTPDKKTKKKPVTMADLADQINDLKATIRRMDPKLNMCVNKTEAIQQSLAAHWSKREEHNDWMMPKVMDIHRGIERLLATPQDVTGTPVDIKVTIPEQGLEPGDYTDASKEVADALTAMGFKWIGEWRNFHAYIRWIKDRAAMVNNCAHSTSYTKFTPATFLSRAAVTAKKLGLVAKEEEPWKPEINISITVDDGSGKKVIFRP